MALPSVSDGDVGIFDDARVAATVGDRAARMEWRSIFPYYRTMGTGAKRKPALSPKHQNTPKTVLRPMPPESERSSLLDYLLISIACKNAQNSRFVLYGRNESSSVATGIASPGITLAFRSKACFRCRFASARFFSPASAHARL
jgi:hypothetical protein